MTLWLRDINKVLIFLVGFIIGSLISAWWLKNFTYTLDLWSKIATIVGGASIIFVAKGFLYQQEADKAVHVIAVLKLFRNEIIPKARELDKLAVELNSTYSPASSWPKAIFDSDLYSEKFPLETGIQKSLIANDDYHSRQIFLLNIMEEFCLDV